jgi:hypothetical protein
MSSFSALKNRIKSHGKTNSPEGWLGLLKSTFTPDEEETLIQTQSLILEAMLGGEDEFEAAVEQAVRLIMEKLDYSLADSVDFIRLGKELIDRMPDRPDVKAKMSAYFDPFGNPYISQTRH